MIAPGGLKYFWVILTEKVFGKGKNMFEGYTFKSENCELLQMHLKHLNILKKCIFL